MTSSTALTVIAICLTVLTLMAIGALLAFILVLRHLLGFEKRLVDELTELRDLMTHLRQTIDGVSGTVKDVQLAARRVGGVLSVLASWTAGRTLRGRAEDKLKPWWMSGLALGMGLWKRRKKSPGTQKSTSSRSASV